MRTLVAEVLAAWRRAERLAAELPPGSAEQAAAQRAGERLRDLYQELVSSGVVEPLSEAGARALLEELTED
jgi:ABC-type nitrate/sulfonate/bicarbonate transport system substrate-binding protein